jgi:redox-sensitive bicupin YhaK (pirin superfamily)
LVDSLNTVLLNKDGDGISIEALEDTRVLLMSGEPLNEEVVSHGPFVMNSQTEILEAMRDYQMGKMGMLIEE